MSIPLLFSPSLVNGVLYADGGLRYPIPVEVAESLGADFIIAFDATSLASSLADDFSTPWSVLSQTTIIMSEDTKKRELDRSDVAISPVGENISMMDFDSLSMLIGLGYNAAKKAMPEIKQKIKEKELLKHYKPCPDSLLLTFIEIEDIEFHHSCKNLKQKADSLYMTGEYSMVRAFIKDKDDKRKIQYETRKSPPLWDILFKNKIKAFDLDTLLSFLPTPPLNLSISGFWTVADKYHKFL
jgi:hypothetical protein